jgi:acetyl-CoA C-acetyltransferase
VSAPDVAVVGVGIHPFGRHEGVSGLEMAAVAARAALRDAGVGWQDVEFAAGGSDAAGNADTTVSVLGLTGVPFINVRNGCATGGSALATAHAMLMARTAEIALVVGFDKHPPGAFNPLPEEWGLGSWYGETGLMLTTQFFAMKIQRYMADHGISESTLAKVAAKAFANGARNPNAWRRRPLSEDEVLNSKMVNHPLRQYMFCSPGEGAVALVLARGERARTLARAPVYLRSVAFRTRRFGSFEVFSPSIPIATAPSPTTEAAAAAFE